MKKTTSDFIRKMINQKIEKNWLDELAKEPLYIIKNILWENDRHRYNLLRNKNNFEKDLMLEILKKKILYFQNGVSVWITENYKNYVDIINTIKNCYRETSI